MEHRKTRTGRSRRLVSGMLAAIMLFGSFLGTAPAAAYAKEPEKETAGLTVTLTQASNGKLSFSDAEGDTRETKPGESVTVKAEPDDGYRVEYIVKTDESGNAEDLAVSNNMATFEADQSVDITASFIKGDTEGVNQPLELSVDEGKDVSKTETVQDYIAKHADKSKIGNGDVRAIDMMWVTHTFVDGKQLPDAKLDTLWGVDEDNDGIADNESAFLSQSDDVILLYRASEDADYFVGKVGGDVTNAKVTDWMAGKNDISGTTYDDIIYDDETRLVYVPNKYQTKDEDGNIIVYQTKIQILYAVMDTEKASVSMDVTVENDGVKGDVVESGEASGTYMSPFTEITLANDEKAEKNIDNDAIDSVIVNGVSYAKDSNMWQYNEDTGKLFITISPTTIDTLEVKMSDGFVKNIQNFFRGIVGAVSMKAEAAGDIQSLWTFDRTPEAGDSFIVQTFAEYGKSDGILGYMPDSAWGGGTVNDDYRGMHDFIRQVCTDQAIDTSDMKPMDGSGGHGNLNREWSASIDSTTVRTRLGNEILIPGGQQISLGCAHIGINHDFVEDGAPNNGPAGTDRMKITILSVDLENKIIWFGVVVPTVNTQAGYGAFYVTWDEEPSEGQIRLKKYSKKPEITDNNRCYDMTGIKYGVYKDRECTDRVQTLTVKNNSGYTEYSKGLDEGTYYVQEIDKETLLEKCGYLYNDGVKAVSVTADRKVTIHMDGYMAEEPANDPTNLQIQKAIDKLKPGKPSGDYVDLAGIKFRLDYYNNKYTSAARAEKNGTLTASAIFKTDSFGLLKFQNRTYLCDGTDWPYTGRDDFTNQLTNVFPYGTYVIREISTLVGLQIRTEAKAFTVDKDGIHIIGDWEETNAGAKIFENESAADGSLIIYKADKDRKGTEPTGDGSFDGIEYTVYNKSRNEITYKNTVIEKNGVVAKIKIKTGSDGIGKATLDNLPYGTYQVVETAGNASYKKADWAKTFSIRTDGQVVKYDSRDSWNEDEINTQPLNIIKVDENTNKSMGQGDADLTGTEYTITNRSAHSIFLNGTEYRAGAVVAKAVTAWDAARNAYVAKVAALPYGTYEITETKAPTGYSVKAFTKTVQFHTPGQTVEFSNPNPVWRGGISVTKADADWNTSNPEGDATLEGVTYDIINKSKHPVTLPGSSAEIANGQVVMTITTKWDEATKSYVATTGEKKLPYGTYDLVETASSVGYLNAGWKVEGIQILQDGEMHCFDEPEDKPHVSGLKYHSRWNVNPVQRGGILVGKVDRETGQYISLGEAHLDGAMFKIINRSEHPVYVNGKTYQVGDQVMVITTKEMEHNGKKIYAATTGEKVLPYGTYEIQEIGSGVGYLYDKESKAYTKTVSIRKDGEMKELLDPEKGETVANQVIREDWNFKKKAEDTMERMEQIAFLVESLTTGERHVITTDENGMWGSAWVPHTTKTNANDPTSPITNGAMGVDENGEWYVKDSSKLDCDAGTWFTGMPEDMVTWAADGKSYDVNGKNVTVKDNKRAFPYDTYRVQELRCANNEGYGLVSFTVTLHRYGSDPDGPGMEIDYGTIDDKRLEIGTVLANAENFGKVVPANAEVKLTDTVTYGNLVVGKKYTMKGELHLVGADGKDEGVVATETKDFTPQKGSGRMTMEFAIKTENMDKKKLVAFEYLIEDGQVIASHEDLEDEEQTVRIPKIETTLNGDLGHMSNVKLEDITLVDTITYEGFEVGKEYVATGTLMKKTTNEDGSVGEEPLLDKDGKKITATAPFVAVKESGSVDVVFKFSNVEVAGETIVAFESVTHNGIEYAVHADINDENQTGTFPEIDTYAVDAADGNKEIAEAEGQSIKDAVELKKLEDGYEYKLAGEIHVRNAEGVDEGALLDAEGKPYTQELTWEGSAKDQMMLFEGIDASKLGGKHLVVFQNLYGKGKDDKDWVLLAEHDDIADEDQSVSVPHVGTTLVTGQDIHESQVPEDGIIKLTDTVAYENVIPGHEYAVTGILHVQEKGEDGSIKDGGEVKDGKDVVTATAVFTPEKAEGTVDVTFEFNAKGLEGKSVTAFEYLYSNPVSDIPDGWKDKFEPEDEDADMEKPKDEWKVASHEDIEDEGQTVHFAEIRTTLMGVDGTHEAQVPAGENKTVTLTDVVKYKGLIPGREYTVTGTLHKQVVDEDGNITDGGPLMMADAESTDTETKDDADAETKDDVESTDTETKDDADAETKDDVESTDTETKDDADNAETKDDVESTDTETKDDADNAETKDDITPGDATKDETDNKPEGKPVTATATFVATESDGEIEVVFTFDASLLEGETVVAFEEISTDRKVFAVHADITDEAQSVHFVKIGTEASAENGLHETQVPAGEDKTVTIKDKVMYENVIPGTEYTMSGTLHIQTVGADGSISDGGEVKDKDGNPVTSTVTFTPEGKNGFVEMEFKFDASELEGRTVVAFEDLKLGDKVVASHADITDEAQSVTFVRIRTHAVAENGEKSMELSSDKKTVKLTDRVTYEGLVPGREYTMTGEFHLKGMDDKGNVVDKGILADSSKKPIQSKVTFKPEAANGSIDIEFEVPTKGLGGNTLVAFETLTQNDIVVATHADITDEDQSVSFTKEPEKPEEPKDEPEKPDTPTEKPEKPVKKPEKPAKTPTPEKPETPDVVPSPKPNTPSPIVETIKEIVKTGQAPFYLISALVGVALMVGGGYFIIRKKRS